LDGVSGDGRTRELLDELRKLLRRAAEETPAPSPTLTPLQGYAAELRDLCRRVLEEADEQTAVAFWEFLIETAARHGRRAGGSTS
jgi:hypothetical protein